MRVSVPFKKKKKKKKKERKSYAWRWSLCVLSAYSDSFRYRPENARERSALSRLSNLQSSLLRCGTRPNEWGAQ